MTRTCREDNAREGERRDRRVRVAVRDDSVFDTVWGQVIPGVFPCARSKPVTRRPSQFHPLPSLRVECRGNIYLENGIGGSIRAALAAAAHPCTLSTQDLRKSCESAKGRSVKLGDPHSSTRVLLRRNLHDPSRDKTTPPSTRALHDAWCPGDAACSQSIPTDRGDLRPFCLQSRICRRSARLEAF